MLSQAVRLICCVCHQESGLTIQVSWPAEELTQPLLSYSVGYHRGNNTARLLFRDTFCGSFLVCPLLSTPYRRLSVRIDPGMITRFILPWFYNSSLAFVPAVVKIEGSGRISVATTGRWRAACSVIGDKSSAELLGQEPRQINAGAGTCLPLLSSTKTHFPH